MPADVFDLIIVGAGSGGLTAARFAAQLGARVALIEKNRIGGDCTWTGCVPSKALLKAAKVAHTVRTSERFGIRAGLPVADMEGVRAYVREAIGAVYRFEQPEELRKDGIEVIEGAARFVDEHTVAAGDRLIRAKKFLLTTGARPNIPDITGLNDVPYTTYEQIFDNDRLPESLIVVGGGPVGFEIAQAYVRLGARVTLVARRILPKDDPDAAAVIRCVLEHEGVRFMADRAQAVWEEGGAIVLSAGGAEVRGDLLFVASGRRPNVAGLDLEKVGIEYSARGIPVDRLLRTSVKHIYAAGDVTGGHQFTHYAAWQAFQAARNALLPGGNAGVADLVPWVTFTDPELAQAGLTEQAARAKLGDRVNVSRWDTSHTDRAVCEGEHQGFIKLMTDRDAVIVGATIVHARAGDVATELIAAIRNRTKVAELAGTIHPYPTYSSAVQQLAAEMATESSLSGTRGEIIRFLSRIFR